MNKNNAKAYYGGEALAEIPNDTDYCLVDELWVGKFKLLESVIISHLF